ncbi:EAL domain-containing protein [Rheinheimera muenzenbergensis]|uniref:EAL domain-containing protein n=1 Tax=Rheinheimera muenzenbergensis TaxID=1193628 RepID=A0ABU8CAF4_9GAMM
MTFFAFAASLLNSTYAMRDYLDQQLASHARDAAHNLGLAISASDANDLVLVHTLASSLFDSGYYQQIRFINNEQQELLNLQHQQQADVPLWFANRFALNAPLMQSEIGDGWINLGQLTVQSHTGLAQQALWQQTKSNALSALLLFLLAALSIHFILRALLKPLYHIAEQAKAVTRKEFRQNEHRTNTRELRTVMSALNVMVRNIGQVFNEQNQQAELLLQEAYLDPLTAVPNRRAMQQRLAALRDDARQAHNDLYVAMITLNSLSQVNTELGFNSGDDYVKQAAQLLQQLHPQLETYRVSGSEFILLGTLTKQQATDADLQLQQLLQNHDSARYDNGFASAVSLLVAPDEAFDKMMARLDSLQTQDTLFMLNSWHIDAKTTEVAAIGREQWQALLQRLLSSGQTSKHIQLLLLPVVDNNGQLLYAEALLRFVVDQQQLSTLEVLAMAQKLGLADELERQMLQFSLDNLRQLQGGAVALNISSAVLQSSVLSNWLLQQLDQQADQLPALLVEIAESSLLQLPEQCARLITELKKRNISVVIERFGANLTSLRHIQNLDIDYVKLDASFSAAPDLDNNRFVISTLTQICHSVGIKVLTTHLESKNFINKLKLLNIDGFQGFAVNEITNFTLLSKKEDASKNKIPYTLTQLLNPNGDTYDAS